VIIRDGEMVALNHQATVLISDEELPLEQVQKIQASKEHKPQEQLVTC
jgi:hypothetical protein